jgi:hypothetical protein
MRKIRLQPFVSAGETILRKDGSMEVVPMQLFPRRGGGAILRIGDSTFWFNDDGSYDGPEHSFPNRRLTEIEAMEISKLLEGCKESRGLAPERPYFEPGTEGWRNELEGWPPEARREQEKAERSQALIDAMTGKKPEEPQVFVKKLDDGPKN